MKKLLFILTALHSIAGFAQEPFTDEEDWNQDVAVAKDLGLYAGDSSSDAFKPYWTGVVFIEFGLLSNHGNANGRDESSFAIQSEFSGVKYFSEKSFFGIGLGFRPSYLDKTIRYTVPGRNNKPESKSLSSSRNIYDIYVPLDLGTSMNRGSSKFNMFVSGGIYTGLAVHAEDETWGSDLPRTKIKKKDMEDFDELAFGLRAHAFMTIKGFVIGAFSTIGLAGHDKKVNYYGITFGYGIGGLD